MFKVRLMRVACGTASTKLVSALVGDIEFEELLRHTWVDSQHLSTKFLEDVSSMATFR